MKKVLFLSICLYISIAFVSAQAPQKISYQAVARNADGNPIASQAISLRFTILDLTPLGLELYKETFSSVLTNQLGLFSLSIGDGVPVAGTFSSINWGSGDKYLRVEIDTANGSSFTNMGISQLLSVPYALYSGNGLPVNGVAPGDMLYWNGVAWTFVPVGLPGQILTLNPALIPTWQSGSSSLQSPSVLIEPATNVTPTVATLHGKVNANNLLTSVVFEYGLTTAYGTQVTASPAQISGNILTDVSASLASLTANTLYHYRIVATNAVDISYSNDATFTTASTTNVLTIVKDGAGSGTVTNINNAINCGNVCSASFPYGATITLTATPTATDGSSFAGWSGGGCSGTGNCITTLTAAQTITATFTTSYNLLTVVKAGGASGNVTSSPNGITCGTDCSELFAPGTVVNLIATPGGGAVFAGWSGGGCSGTANCITTMNAAQTVTATFTPSSYALTVVKAGSGAGTVSSSPAGISCGSDCSELYSAGTVVSLTATPSVGSSFTGWSGGGCSGTGACITTLSAAQTVTANFTLQTFPITLTKTGSGTGIVTSSPAGINCGADCSEFYDYGTSVTFTAIPDAGSHFTGFTGCSGNPNCATTVTAATSVTANFVLDDVLLTVVKAGTGSGTVSNGPSNGISCGSDCSELYAPGSVVTLTATPNANSIFTGWSGGGCSGTGTCVTTMNAAQTVTATFTGTIFDLTVVKTGTGTGTVTSSPAGINCGLDCSESYATGTVVTLTAAGTFGSSFAGWSGGGCSGTGTCVTTMNQAQTVTALFSNTDFQLTVSKTGSGTGTITSSPAGINCGADCSEMYPSGSSITLTATPTAGSTFTGWSGGGCSGTGTCITTMTAAQSVSAAFTSNSDVLLTVTKSGSGTGNVNNGGGGGINCGQDCSELFPLGTVVTLNASPGAGSAFAGWSGGGCSGTGTCVTTMTAAQTVNASFVATNFALTVTRAGTGTGTVSSSPAGISCGSDCAESYSAGSTITLTATPVAGSTFTGWSGGGCSGTGTCVTTMNSAQAVTATFTATSFTLTVNKNGFGSGTVTSSPAGINCGGDCSESYPAGTVVTLTANPTFGFFTGWSGGGCSGTGNCTTTINAATTVTATFN